MMLTAAVNGIDSILYVSCCQPAKHQGRRARGVILLHGLHVPVSGLLCCVSQVHRVTIPQLRRILRSRQMMLPSVCTCYYALDELAERGLL